MDMSSGSIGQKTINDNEKWEMNTTARDPIIRSFWGRGPEIVHTDDWDGSRKKNDMTKGTKNHGLQKVVGLLVERSVVGDDDAYLTGEI